MIGAYPLIKHLQVHNLQGSANTHSIPAGGLHDLTQSDAHALPLIALLGPQAFLKDGDDLREDFLP